MDKHIKDILKGALQEALKLPVDQLDKVDPTKLTKLATKADVVIGEDDTQLVDPKMMQNIKTILFSIISEQGITDASFYLAAKLPIPPARMAHIFSKPTWGENLEDFLKGVPTEDLERFYQEEKDRLQPTLNEDPYIQSPQTSTTATMGGIETSYGINEESQFPTATPEQQQGIFDLQSWAAELGVDIGVGEETVGDIIKFGFEGADGWVTILVDPNGKIKVSGHAINTFEDFSDILKFFQD